MKQDSKPVMSNTVDKHTPGEWKQEQRMGEILIHTDTMDICTVYEIDIDPEEAEANAALIAAAPQLKKENEELKEQMAQSMRLYECQNNTIIKLQERNRVLVEALSGLMGRCIIAIQGTDNFRMRHSSQFKAAEKALQSNQ